MIFRILLLLLLFFPVFHAGALTLRDVGNRIREAELLMNLGDYAEALRLLDEANGCADIPTGTLYDLWCDRAVCLKHRGAYEEALSSYQRARQYADTSMETANLDYNLASLLIAMGQYQPADSLLGSVTEPSYRDWCVLKRSELLCRQGKSGEALALLEPCVAGADRGSESYPYLLQNHAYLLEEQPGRALQALDEIGEALTLLPPQQPRPRHPNGEPCQGRGARRHAWRGAGAYS